MPTRPAPPHVVAAADQFLAAHNAGVASDQIAHAIFRWIGRQWSAGATPDALVRLDHDLERLAFHLAAQRPNSAPPAVRDADGACIDPHVALAQNPELHGAVIPVITLSHLAHNRPYDAQRAWRHLSLAAAAADTAAMGTRTANVINALTVLVRHAGARVAAA